MKMKAEMRERSVFKFNITRNEIREGLVSRTDEIIAAAKMPPEAVRMSRYIDAVYFPILCILLVGTFHMHFMLLAGDWDFWLDWKDRQWWPVVTPIVGIMYCAALQYYLWVNYRLGYGATLCIVCLLVGEWLTRYWGFALVVTLSTELCIAIDHDSWCVDDGYDSVVDRKLVDYSAGRRWILWFVLLPRQLADFWPDPLASGS